jgi:signal transduction histidine kinase
MDCVMRASGADPTQAGQSQSQRVDADGKRFAAEFIEVARTRGRGWIDYRWTNPVTKRDEPKSTYVEREGDFVLACGIYRREEATQASAARPARRIESARDLPRLRG